MRALLATLLALGAAFSQAAVPSDPSLAIVDVVVSDARGRTPGDLRREDFEVLIDGAARAIDTVRFVRTDPHARLDEPLRPIGSRADEQEEARREGVRVFAFFLDEYHVTPGEGVRQARATLTAFVTNQLGPRDLMLVVKPLDSLVGLRATRDRAAVLAEIAGFEGRRGDYRARTAFEQSVIAGTPARIEAVRAQVAISALNAMAAHLGGLSTNRKTMIVVSEGFGAASGRRPRGTDALPTLDGAIGSANRARASIYALDPRALPGVAIDAAPSAPDEAAHRDMLRRLAVETDGYPVLESADVEAGLSRAASDSSAYYLIAFQPGEGDEGERSGGRFRAVQLRVHRPGVVLRARPGVWQPAPDESMLARLTGPAAGSEPLPDLPRRSSPLIRPWFGMARGEAGQTRVTFVWERAARVPGIRDRGPEPARITLRALAPEGAPRFEGAVRPAAGGVPGSDPAQAVFDAAPGRLRLEMAIEDAFARVIDTDVREIVVGSLGGPVALGSPGVMRAPTAREYRALLADPEAVPVASRTFSRTDRLLIRLPAYAEDGAPIVTAHLASAIGGDMRELPVAPGPRPGLHQVDLPLASLPAGDYIVRIVARGAGREATELVGFRVTP